MYAVILGGGPDQVPLIDHALRLNLSTIVIDREMKPGLERADIGIMRSIYDADECWRAVQGYPFWTVFNRASGPACITSAVLTTRKGLPGISPSAAEALTDKSRIDLPWLPQRTVAAPCVVKPALYTGGGVGVQRCDDDLQTFLALAEASRLSFNGKAICEEYVEGQDVSLIGVVNETFFPLSLLDDKQRPSEFTATPVEAELIGIAEEIVSRYSIERCPLSIDFRVGDRVWVLEVHLELPGDGILESYPEAFEAAVRMLAT